MKILALETSCDETSAAIVCDGEIRANVVASQIALHAEYGGVVPELATREHLRNWRPAAESALRSAGLGLRDLDAIAATQGPGLPNALMVGLKAAQGMAYALRKPFVGIHHHEAHWNIEYSGQRSTTRRANVLTRRRSSLACRIRAARNWTGWRHAAIRRPTSFRGRCCGRTMMTSASRD